MNKYFSIILLFVSNLQATEETLSKEEVKRSFLQASGITEVKPEFLYSVKERENLYFIVERVTPQTEAFWKKFASDQYNQLANYPRKYTDGDSTKKIDSKDGSTGLDEIINYNPGFKYMAYACWNPVEALGTVQKKDIEMSFCVLTDQNLPWVSHMGISRNPFFADEEDRQFHKKISIGLHSFSGMVMKLLFPHKIYMLTRPVKVMWNLFLDEIPEGALFVGDNLDKGELLKEAQKKFEVAQTEEGKSIAAILRGWKFDPFGKTKAILEKYPSPISYKEDDFVLTDLNAKEMLSLTEKQYENHPWFFRSFVFCNTLSPMCTIHLDTLAAQGESWTYPLFNVKTSEEYNFFIQFGCSEKTKNKKGEFPKCP